MEMVLHHFMTIFLIMLSYLMNCIDVGSLIIFVHDLVCARGGRFC